MQVGIRQTASASGALGDVVAGELDVHSAEVRTHLGVNAERDIQLFQDVLEAPCLESAAGRFGVAVHRVADPQHRLARLANRLDGPRQGGLHVARAEAVDQGEAPRLILGVERGDQPLQPGGIHRRADLDGDGIGDTAKVLDVRAVELRGAHSDPRQVRGKVVPAVLSRDEASLRLFIEQMQPLVARVEVDDRRLVHAASTDAFEEIEGIADRAHDALVGFLELRMLDEAEVPILGMVQIGETAIDQRPNKIQCQRRPLVAPQQQLGIRRARLGGEFRAIDEIAAVARKREPVAGLHVRRAGLGVLPGHAPDADDRFLQPVQQHETHLQENLQLFRDGVGFAVGERLGAIAALQQERLPALGGGQTLAQRLHFPGDHDRRQP